MDRFYRYDERNDEYGSQGLDKGAGSAENAERK